VRLAVAGISHRTAPLEIRERLLLSSDDHARVLSETNATELVLLSTCNRTEIYARDVSAETLRKVLTRGVDLPPGALYLLEDVAAVRHLFRVAASLDSLVLGENQILGQILAAEEAAHAAATAGGFLRRLFATARRCGKTARHRTRIGEGAVSVASIALELARKVFGDLAGRRILLLGSGDMASAAAIHLRGQGAVVTVTAHSRLDRAEVVAAEVGGTAVMLSDLPRLLSEIDVVLASTAGATPVLTASTIRNAMRERADPLLILDIAIPRNVENVAREIDNVYLYDLDGFEEIAERRREARRDEATRAEEIVETDVAAFLRWVDSRAASRTIEDLTRRADAIREDVWKEMRALLNGAPPETVQRTEYLMTLLTRKLLHEPFAAVREGDSVFPVEERVAALRALFGMDRRS
jgi:glutamyl-tRNA reductase